MALKFSIGSSAENEKKCDAGCCEKIGVCSTHTHARTLADKKKEQRGARRTGKINSVPWRVVHKREKSGAHKEAK
jgi:hypothetical protein